MKKVIEMEAIPDSQRARKIVQAGLSERLGDMTALSLAVRSELHIQLKIRKQYEHKITLELYLFSQLKLMQILI